MSFNGNFKFRTTNFAVYVLNEPSQRVRFMQTYFTGRHISTYIELYTGCFGTN